MFSGKKKSFMKTKVRPFTSKKQISRFADEEINPFQYLVGEEPKQVTTGYSEPIGPQIPAGATITMPTSSPVVPQPAQTTTTTEYIKAATPIVEAIIGKPVYQTQPKPYVSPYAKSSLFGNTSLTTVALMGGAGIITVLLLSNLAGGSVSRSSQR